jgi:hypothetical protein
MVNEVMITSVYKVDIGRPGNVGGEWAIYADIAVVGVKEHIIVDLSEHFGGDVVVNEGVGRIRSLDCRLIKGTGGTAVIGGSIRAGNGAVNGVRMSFELLLADWTNLLHD